MPLNKAPEQYAALADPEASRSGDAQNVPPNAAGATVITSIINIAAAVLGAGLLGLPFGFSEAGWLVSCIMLIGSGILSCFTMHLLSVVRLVQTCRNGVATLLLPARTILTSHTHASLI
jgi:hypothetical protein